MEKMRKKMKFNSLERIQRIHIETDSWQRLDLITTSFKKKRNDLKIYYKDVIAKLYEGLD
jgi:long-subunit acyl-CoA synthetase (AMP-forming)